MTRVTVVNDNPEFLELIEAILEDERFQTTTIDGDRETALQEIVDSEPDVLVIDLRMAANELHGWEIAQKVRAAPSLDDLPILVCSADVVALSELAEDLADRPRVATLQKPFGIDELVATIDELEASQ